MILNLPGIESMVSFRGKSFFLLRVVLLVDSFGSFRLTGCTWSLIVSLDSSVSGS